MSHAGKVQYKACAIVKYLPGMPICSQP